MASQLQLRRGTKTEHESFTGQVGETTVETTNDDLRVHDGSTVGGKSAAQGNKYDGIKQLDNAPLKDRAQYDVAGFYVGTEVGGGQFIYDANRDKADHNGGTVITPEAIAAWDGTQGNLSVLLDWTGTGTGAFVRTNFEVVTPQMFGAISDFNFDSTKSFWAAYEVPIIPMFFAGTFLITEGHERLGQKLLYGGGMDASIIRFDPATTTEAFFKKPSSNIAGSVIRDFYISVADYDSGFVDPSDPTKTELENMNDNVLFEDIGLRYGCKAERVRAHGFGVPRYIENSYYCQTSELHFRYFKRCYAFGANSQGTGDTHIVSYNADYSSSYAICLNIFRFENSNLGFNFYNPACEKVMVSAWDNIYSYSVNILEPYYEYTTVAVEHKSDIGHFVHENPVYALPNSGDIGVKALNSGKITAERGSVVWDSATIKSDGFYPLVIATDIARVDYSPVVDKFSEAIPITYDTSVASPSATIATSRIQYTSSVLYQKTGAQSRIFVDESETNPLQDGVYVPFDDVNEALVAFGVEGAVSKTSSTDAESDYISVLFNANYSTGRIRCRDIPFNLLVDANGFSVTLEETRLENCQKAIIRGVAITPAAGNTHSTYTENCNQVKYENMTYNGTSDYVFVVRNSYVEDSGSTTTKSALAIVEQRGVLKTNLTGSTVVDASSAVI